MFNLDNTHNFVQTIASGWRLLESREHVFVLQDAEFWEYVPTPKELMVAHSVVNLGFVTWEGLLTDKGSNYLEGIIPEDQRVTVSWWAQ